MSEGLIYMETPFYILIIGTDVWYHDGMTTEVAVKMREILTNSLPKKLLKCN